MKIENKQPPTLSTCLSPSLLHLYDVSSSIVVIIDILRATSTIATALYNGAKSIIPVDSVAECIKLGKTNGRNHRWRKRWKNCRWFKIWKYTLSIHSRNSLKERHWFSQQQMEQDCCTWHWQMVLQELLQVHFVIFQRCVIT